MELTLKDSVGSIYFARFSKDGEISEFEITEQEYNGGPTKEGYIFLNAGCEPKFDTVSGRLEDGQYADFGDYYAVKLEGCIQSCVSKDKIIDDVLDDSVASLIQSEGGNPIEIYGS